MPRLVLVRHAKSSWSTGAGDRERPLDDRGREQAALMRDHIATLDLAAPRVLVSSALRTRETWKAIATACPGARAEVRDDLYLADAKAYSAAINEHEGDTVLVGHNPTCAELLSAWGTGDGKYPTGSISVFERGSPPRLVSFASPRMLAERV